MDVGAKDKQCVYQKWHLYFEAFVGICMEDCVGWDMIPIRGRKGTFREYSVDSNKCLASIIVL
jgi:hypothetical protein